METTKAQTMKNVNKNAWQLVKEKGLKWFEAIKQGWQLVKKEIAKKYKETLILLALSADIFEIEFTKVSTGEITKRVCSNAKLKETKENTQNLLFFSITDNGFRSCQIDSILNIRKLENSKLTIVNI